jgi:hypothetical protein
MYAQRKLRKVKAKPEKNADELCQKDKEFHDKNEQLYEKDEELLRLQAVSLQGV